MKASNIHSLLLLAACCCRRLGFLPGADWAFCQDARIHAFAGIHWKHTGRTRYLEKRTFKRKQQFLQPLPAFVGDLVVGDLRVVVGDFLEGDLVKSDLLVDERRKIQ